MNRKEKRQHIKETIGFKKFKHVKTLDFSKIKKDDFTWKCCDKMSGGGGS